MMCHRDPLAECVERGHDESNTFSRGEIDRRVPRIDHSRRIDGFAARDLVRFETFRIPNGRRDRNFSATSPSHDESIRI